MTKKYAFLGDIHGNIEALEAVLKDIDIEKPDKIIVLGDTIGYGPNPRECLKKVYEEADIVLIGNHEKEAIEPDDDMCGDAEEALKWTAKELKGLNEWEEIKNLVKSDGYRRLALKKDDDRIYVHGTPRAPVQQYLWPGHESYYIQYNDQLDERLLEFMDEFTEKHGFNAHMHIPSILTAYENKGLFNVYMDWNRKYTFIGPNAIFFVPVGDVIVEGIADKKVIINPRS